MSPARSVPLAAAISAAALAAAAGVAALELASEHRDARIVWAVFGPAVGLSFVGTGLYAWRRRPDNRIGPLMILFGFCWFVESPQGRGTRLRAEIPLMPRGTS